jgi:predicted amidohydrolase
MRITVCEMPDDPEQFAREWVRLSRHTKRESSDLVLLPEMPFFYWFCSAPRFDPAIWREAVRKHKQWMERISELGATVVLGSRPVDRRGRRLNEGFVWSNKTGVRGVHLKRYLPDEPGYYEARWYERGKKLFAPFRVAGWKAGFMICSDLWSMVNARTYGKNGVELVAVPRATGEESVDKWVAGGRVAAVLAAAYCASSNRTGKRGNARFGGHGWVIDPDGGVLALTSKARPFVTVEIERGRADRAKTTYPRDSLEPD